MTGRPGLSPLVDNADDMSLERSAHLLADSSGGFRRIAEAIRKAESRLASLAEALAADPARSDRALESTGLVETGSPPVPTIDELGRELEELRRALGASLAHAEALEQTTARATSRETQARRENEQLADDYLRARTEYERLAREAMILRNESFIDFLRRKWNRLFESAPTRSE
jgi:hypothetical protein